MDILKVLSRGTKQARRTADSTSHGTTLPSAGSRPNPQLFHDAVRGVKRKRANETPKDSDEEALSDIDFFASKDESKSKRKDPNPEAKGPRKPKSQQKTRLLDEDECRQVLRSHRLKFTLLSLREEKKSKIKKSKKSKKKKPAKVDKEEKKQLYPQPLRSFQELRSTYEVSGRLAENLENQAYKVPTEVQLGSLPLLLQPKTALGPVADEETLADGVDFMAVAPTGSGKTLSFLIPAINDIMRRKAHNGDQKGHDLEAIVIAPTRELADQITNEGKKLTVGTGVKVVVMKKGMRVAAEDDMHIEESGDDGHEKDSDTSDEEGSDAGAEVQGQRAGPVTKANILVTTPMLLLNLLRRGSSTRPLPTVKHLVLDEADVLLDPLFREQTIGIWSACTSPDLHITFWSATMGSNVESLIMEQRKLHSDARGVAATPLVRLVVGLKDTAVPNIAHKLVYTATEPGKLLGLRQLLHPVSGADTGPPLRPPFLVFTQTIERASALHDELKYDIPLAAGGSSRIAVLHSSLADSVRAEIMRRFRSGEIWILITTDVLARGVDFAGVNGVVNYDVPNSAAAYVHRAGRTGRAGREGGVAVTFYTKEDIPFVKSVANVIAMSEKQAGKKTGEADVQQWLLDALPDVKKEDKKRLKTRGVEARRTGAQAKITSKSAWERRKEHNRRGAILGSKKRKMEEQQGGGDSEWSGIEN